MLKLKVVGDDREGIWLVEPKVSVGRASSNNLVVNDNDVDDCHIEIFAKGEDLIIHRRSDAVTLVNGNKLGIKAKLGVSDVITVGRTQLEVIDPKVLRRRQSTAHEETTLHNEPQSWFLVPKQSGLGSSRYELKDGSVIGRSKDCDVVILLAHLSRRHAKFSLVNNNRLEVTDLNSSNGTFVNGKQIATAVLKHGDELKLDSLAFRVTGPNDDMDKTMVRPMKLDSLEKQLAAHDKNPASSAPAKPAAAVQSAPVQAATVTAAKDTTSSSNAALIIVGIVAVVAIVAGVVLLA